MYESLSPDDCGCRTTFCPHCNSIHFKRNGSFFRKDDGRRVQRYLCVDCQRSFSRAGFSFFYRQRHRRLNDSIAKLLAMGMTQRGIARYHSIDKDTVARHLITLAKRARVRHRRSRDQWPLAEIVQFDDLITFEHTKFKQVAISVLTDAERWRVIDFRVSAIPTSGLLAKKAVEKYGPRPDDSIAARVRMILLGSLFIHPKAIIITDQHRDYPPLVSQYLPYATHVSYKGAKATIVGQGELKQGQYDPLFCINHQLASFREGIARLKRRTWSTTKRIERLADHVMIFIDHYNRLKRPQSALDIERYYENTQTVERNDQAAAF